MRRQRKKGSSQSSSSAVESSWCAVEGCLEEAQFQSYALRLLLRQEEKFMRELLEQKDKTCWEPIAERLSLNTFKELMSAQAVLQEIIEKG